MISAIAVLVSGSWTRACLWREGIGIDARIRDAKTYPRFRSADRPMSVKELQLMRVSTFLVRIAMFVMSIALSGSAAAQSNYPTKAIRYIVPYPPGGSTDPVARMISAKLADRL